MTVRTGAATGNAEITSKRVSVWLRPQTPTACLRTQEVEATDDVGRMLEAVGLAIVCSALN